MAAQERGTDSRDHKGNLLVGMGPFGILTVVIISHVKTNCTTDFKYDSLLNVNYTSIKLFFNAACSNPDLNKLFKNS